MVDLIDLVCLLLHLLLQRLYGMQLLLKHEVSLGLFILNVFVDTQWQCEIELNVHVALIALIHIVV